MKLLYYLFIAYILMPKINLIPLGGSAFRLTDLIFLAAMLLYLELRGFAFPKIQALRIYSFFVAFEFFSLVMNGGLGYPFAILNVLRLLQYTCWAYIGYDLARSNFVTPKRFALDMRNITIFLFVWAVLEATHIVPKLGKFSDVQERISLNTSGPFEISVVASFLLLVTSDTMPKWMAFTVTLLSQARVTIAALVLLVLKRYVRILIPFLLLSIPVALLIPWAAIFAGTRLSQIPDPTVALNGLIWYWNHTHFVAQTYATGINLEGLYGNRQGELSDVSFAMRAFRWVYALLATFSTVRSTLIGSGPGSWGAAVDGYYIRLIGEGGIIGAAIFLWFCATMLRDKTLDAAIKSYMICLLITASFIDIFITDKPMSLLWFYVGFCSQPKALSYRAPKLATSSPA